MTAPCILCNEPLEEAEIVGTMSRGERPSRRVACSRCGLVQASPAPSTAALAAYYQGDYHEEHQPVPITVSHVDGTGRVVWPTDPDYDDAIATMHRYRARMVVEDLELPKGARVLEIGCSDGRTLLELQKLGMDVYGIEPDGDKARAALDCVNAATEESYRHPYYVQHATLDDYASSFPKEQPYNLCGAWEPYDAVIAFHVVEHLPDPLASLAQIRSLLKPGGKFWCEVPNVYAPSGPLASFHWQWVHLFDFSWETMAALLGRAGLDDIYSRDERGPLQAWGTNLATAPRAYEDHGGPNGRQIADAIRRLEAQETTGSTDPIEIELAAPTVAPAHELQRLRKGEPPYVGPVFDRLRAELAVYDDGVARLASAYHDATDMIGELSHRLDEEGIQRFESWHPDERAYYFALGEGHASWKLKAMLAAAANAMRLVELRDGGKS